MFSASEVLVQINQSIKNILIGLSTEFFFLLQNDIHSKRVSRTKTDFIIKIFIFIFDDLDAKYELYWNYFTRILVFK